MRSIIKLPERLSVISAFIKNGASVADIGTDHGFLPVFLAQTGRTSHIIASDISAGSLEAARRSASKYGVADKITFIVAPGLEKVGETDTDTIVISGVGGETIAGILADAPWTRRHDISLILQPQTKIGVLCKWLYGNGYIIKDARLTLENDRYYVVMLAIGGSAEDDATDPETALLTRLMLNRDALFSGYMDGLISKTEKALDGMKKAGAQELPETIRRLSVYTSLREAYKSLSP